MQETEKLLSTTAFAANAKVYIRDPEGTSEPSAEEICDLIKSLQILAMNPPKLSELREDIESERAASIRLVSDMMGEAIESHRAITRSDAIKWMALLVENL